MDAHTCIPNQTLSHSVSALTDVGVGAIMANCLYLQELSVAGIKLLTSKPFLPLISDVKEWRRCQALLRLKLQEQRMLDAETEHYSSDEVSEWLEGCVCFHGYQ